ncbi:hypothetical protein Tco_0548033 [Tanacetum coccineum]
MLGRQVECLGGETDIVPLSYHIVDDFEIQFGKEEFCPITGLRFGVDYSADYKNEDDPIPFRRRVFSSAKDGLEDRRKVPDWILRLANDRDGSDMYPWGSYVWPTLYSQLKNANVKLWHPLYAVEQEKVDDTKAYSVFGLLGIKLSMFIWILDSFRVGAHEYYRRQRRYPRVGRLLIARLTLDENEALSDWWVSSMAYFDGCISEATRIPRHVNRQNISDVPSEFYREFEEQQRAVDQMMKKDAEREEMYDQMRNFMQDTNVSSVRQAKKGPIIVSQHYGLSDFSGFQSMQGFPHAGLSSLPTQANNFFFEGAQATHPLLA